MSTNKSVSWTNNKLHSRPSTLSTKNFSSLFSLLCVVSSLLSDFLNSFLFSFAAVPLFFNVVDSRPLAYQPAILSLPYIRTGIFSGYLMSPAV